MKLGERLRQIRQARGLTQPELADAIGIEQSYLSKLENDKYVPSADIFGRILEVFEFDVDEFVDDLDHPSRAQLRQIPIVANYYEQQKQLIIGNRRRWLFICSTLLAFGAGLLYAGSVRLFVPAEVYHYQSWGIVLDGEQKEVFLNARSDPFSQESAELLQKRTNKDFLTTRSYRGSIFNIPTEGGSRTYRLERVERVGSWVNKAVASLGVILAVFGLTGFVYERKLARYQ